MRVLFDTNILVAVLSRREAILTFKRTITQDGIIHLSSKHILREVEAVLNERMGLTRQKAKIAARLLERQSVIVEPKLIEKVCRDPFDDYVLAAAIAGNVTYLVTEDKDLLVVKSYKYVRIVRFKHFESMLKKEAHPKGASGEEV